MDFERQIEDVVDALQNAKNKGIKVNLLIGAGCSVTGNIPTADGFINKIKELYPREYKRATSKDYVTCMSKLTPIERRKLIMNVVNDSYVNWAHIAIAQLLKNNLVHRIITTNFDNLVQKACSLVGEYPAIYDLTTSENFRTDLLFEKSVLHLHGQYTGFILCNTGVEVERQAHILNPIFEQLNQNSLWIIVGYSGDNDPVFKLLAQKKFFEYRLFWVGFKENEPNENLKNHLLSEEKYAFFIKGYDADSFFVILSQKLGVFPPNFIRTPFTYLLENLKNISKYSVPNRVLPSTVKNKNQFANQNIQLATKKIIQKAIDKIENDSVLMAEHYLLAGLLDEVIQLDGSGTNSNELEELIITAYVQKQGLSNLKIAETKLKKLIQENNKDIYHNRLAHVYFLLANEDEEGLDISYLIKAFNECLTSIDLNNQRLSILAMNNYLGSILDSYNLLGNKNKVTNEEIDELVETFLEIFDTKYPSAKSTLITSGPIEEEKYHSSSFIYHLIELNNFKMAEKALVIYDKYKDILGRNIPFFQSCWGFWYFRNKEIKPESAEEFGEFNYMAALNFILNNKPFGKENENAFIAFKQKYFLEYARFLWELEGRKKEAVALLLDAISFGENSFNKNIYQDALQLAMGKDLAPIKDALDQVASDQEDKLG